MSGTLALKGSNDRWLSLLIWAVLIWLAWKFSVLLLVHRDWYPPGEPAVPTNPRQLSPAEPPSK